ncbi:helicase-related protein [Oceanithermus sp.]
MALASDELVPGSRVEGLVATGPVTVHEVNHLDGVIEITFRDASGNIHQRLLYPNDLEQLRLLSEVRWPMSASATDFRLAAEARRLRLAHLFDPMMAVHTSLVEPLPHQIEAVYGHLLQRRPLRFLLADDPGAGKTIMTGLYMRELLLRGDLERALVVAPGALVEQWQDELDSKFHLPFEIFSRERVELSRSGNPFLEGPYWIARLDQIARNEDYQEKLAAVDWDLIVVDEAHKLSATFFGRELKKTQRYRLGEKLSRHTRNFLLLTATPHRGKPEDFRLFMALLDPDRFEGRPRPGAPETDAEDLMLRRVKEDLVRFDGTPLFPERRAYTVEYSLSATERQLYEAVTTYVREEMNRAEKLDKRRGNTVGFALAMLQRRLASSPQAIHRSLQRRLKRRRDLLERLERGESIPQPVALDEEDLVERYEYAFPDEEEGPEFEELATSARTKRELELEIASLERLEALARRVIQSGNDRKWQELARLMGTEEIKGRKLVIFTEHRDTLDYLRDRLLTFLGDADALVTIHGGMRREERHHAQAEFTNNKDVLVLLATDAAGEGINLQQAHLLINYDIPWNPNRLEQRFGRIHRIGQTEVCHMWNLVARGTREGDVFALLLKKLETAANALGGRVFDVLGTAFSETPLHELLIQAIRYGENPEVRKRLEQAIEGAVDVTRLQQLVARDALATEVLSQSQLARLKEEMQRAEAARLQPHYVASFFHEAFERLGGTMQPREAGRYEITFVPPLLRPSRAQGRQQVLKKYVRITFDKRRVVVPGRPVAEFVAPGHPLFDAAVMAIEEKLGAALQKGTVLVDPEGGSPRVLGAFEHDVRDGRDEVISQRLLYVEAEPSGSPRKAGPAPYLDYREPTPEEQKLALNTLDRDTVSRLLTEAERFVLTTEAKAHVDEVRKRREEHLNKTLSAVKERLLSEIYYWDGEAQRLGGLAKKGKKNAAVNAEKARRRAEELRVRLKRREQESEEARKIFAGRPHLALAAWVVPPAEGEGGGTALEREVIDQLAVQAVLAQERALGNVPREMPHGNPGYDIESRTSSGELRFIEVKGKGPGKDTFTLSRTQLLTALNKPQNWWLVVVETDGERALRLHYLRNPVTREPEFGVTSVNFDLKQLMQKVVATYEL